MNEKKKQYLKRFLKSLSDLYLEVDEWLETTPLKPSPEQIELREEACGLYNTEKLAIRNPKGIIIAQLMPIGAWVIGASGRIDLIGKLDKLVLVFLEKGGPTLTTTISSGDHEKTSVTKFYQGIEKSGWYWIEDNRRGKAHKITKDIFFELLTEVSDYEFSKSP